MHDIAHDEGARLHDAAQAHQGRAAAVVPPLRPARDARVAGLRQRRRAATAARWSPGRGRRRAAASGSTTAGTASSAAPTPRAARSSAAEVRRTVDLLRNVVSLAVWVPFNEGWGQFDALDIAEELRRLDPTRSIDHASGWHDQGGGDVWSLHVYRRPFEVPQRRRGRRRGCSRSPSTAAHDLVVRGHTWGTHAVRLRPPRDRAGAARGVRRGCTATSSPPRSGGARRHRLHPALRRGGRGQRAADLRPRGGQAAARGGPAGARCSDVAARLTGAWSVKACSKG